MQERSLLVQVLLDMATGGGAKLEPLIVDKAGVFDAGLNRGYNPVTVAGGSTNVAAEKSAVVNHSVVVTPEAVVTAGWQDGKSITGNGVNVNASELVSGNYNVSQAGSADVTNYQNVVVKSGSTTASVDKTTVDAHTVRFTPKANVAQGWQDGGTVSGESIDVAAGELVSGTYPVTESGEFDVSAYEKISVPSGVVAASATKGVVAGHTVTVTPKASRTAGFINNGETEGLGVNITASELVSGTLNVSNSGTQDVTNYESISVPSGGHSASATKGTVSNHSVSVTPKSTATAGFVSAGTVDGTPVSVSASELVSGTLNVSGSGTQDVTNYKNVSVPSGGHSASATKGTVSNHSVSVTPKSTATAGFVSAGEVNGAPVSVNASELVSGTLNVSQSGTQDVTNYKNVSVPSGGHSASATKGTVSNHSVSVTPKSTATAGFVSAGEVNGAPVSVSASELVSGRLSIASNGIIDVTNYKEVEVSGVVTKDSFGNISGTVTTTSSGVALNAFPNPNNLKVTDYDAFLFIFTLTTKLSGYPSAVISFAPLEQPALARRYINICGGVFYNIPANTPITIRSLVTATTFYAQQNTLNASIALTNGNVIGNQNLTALTPYIDSMGEYSGKTFTYSGNMYGLKF